jgi:hypothetical protein
MDSWIVMSWKTHKKRIPLSQFGSVRFLVILWDENLS